MTIIDRLFGNKKQVMENNRAFVIQDHQGSHKLYINNENNEVFAVLVYGMSTHNVFIQEIGVSTKYRRQGYASKLIEELIELYKTNYELPLKISAVASSSKPNEITESSVKWERLSDEQLSAFYTSCGFVKNEKFAYPSDLYELTVS